MNHGAAAGTGDEGEGNCLSSSSIGGKRLHHRAVLSHSRERVAQWDQRALGWSPAAGKSQNKPQPQDSAPPAAAHPALPSRGPVVEFIRGQRRDWMGRDMPMVGASAGK